MAPLLVPLFLSFLLTSYSQDIVPKADFVLGKKVPDVTLIDEKGKSVRLSEIVKGEPVLISLIYTRCTSSCPMIVRGIRDALAGMKEEVRVLLVDFDERDTPKDLVEYRKKRGITDKRWILALAKGDSLKSLTRALDFKYFYDEKTDMFAHPNVLVILSPDLKVSGYILGLRYDPDKLSDIVAKARVGEVDINPIKGALLKCFRYDPITGTYYIDWSFVAMVIGGIIPIAGMFYFIFLRDLLSSLRRAT